MSITIRCGRPRICLMLVYDGRNDDLWKCVASLLHGLVGGWTSVVVVDDSAHTLGFAGAVQDGWDKVLALDPVPDYVFHLEADFVLREPVPLASMVELLEAHPEIAQVSLKRQPVNERELAAGGIIEADPDDFTEINGGHVWVSHRRYWTTNPSLYSTRWCRMGWPQESHSEGLFTHRLLRDPLLRFAIWGSLNDPPRVEHVGRRVGVGY